MGHHHALPTSVGTTRWPSPSDAQPRTKRDEVAIAPCSFRRARRDALPRPAHFGERDGAPPRPARFGGQDVMATSLVPLARGQPDGNHHALPTSVSRMRWPTPFDSHPRRTRRGGHHALLVSAGKMRWPPRPAHFGERDGAPPRRAHSGGQDVMAASLVSFVSGEPDGQPPRLVYFGRQGGMAHPIRRTGGERGEVAITPCSSRRARRDDLPVPPTSVSEMGRHHARLTSVGRT